MITVMVTGATGLLGRAVVKGFEAQEVELLACGYSRTGEQGVCLDLMDRQAVDELIGRHRPDVIIHCAAERRPDVSERFPEQALALNVEASRHLACIAARYGAWLIYISTDYVFDGMAPDYAEDQRTRPLNFYGKSKRQGELAVLRVSAEFAVLRLPILYGEVESLDESAILVMLKQLINPSPQQQDDWAVRSPTSTQDIANALVKLVHRHMQQGDVSGIYHFSASQRMTKYQMLVQMAQLLGLSSRHIVPATTPTDAAQRPRDCSLSMARLKSLAINSEIDFLQGLKYSLSHSAEALAKCGLHFDLK